MTANTLTDVYHFPAAVSVSDGFLSAELSEQDAERCRPLMEGFLLHLTGLQEQYPQHIQVIITEV